jgi:peptidoglycan/xylan/chitin deacetylase (PgdA/CDA1 family)
MCSAFSVEAQNTEPAGAEVQTCKLPIVMYHKVLKRHISKYSVSPDQLREDFTAILDAGFTPVFMSEVIDFVEGNGKLPEKPIVITFDDGYYNNLYYALPIAKELGVKFMMYPVTGYSKFTIDTKDESNPNYSHVTWEQIKEGVDSGLIEMGNHSHKMHSFKPRFGISKLNAESDEEYETRLKADIEEAQTLIENCHVPRPMTFAYPFGKYSAKAREVLIDMGFHALLTCNERVSTITKGDPKSIHALGRFNRDGDMSTERLLKKID